jgi:ABC-2 type transport system permease protein
MRTEFRRRLRFAARTLAVYAVAIVLFEYLLVLVFDTLDVERLQPIFESLPRALQALLGADVERLLSAQGFLGIIFTHPVMLVLVAAFPIAFAAGALAGEVERRTIALVLVRPITRARIVASAALVVTLAVALLFAAIWSGMALWTRVRGLGPIDLMPYAWAAAAGAALCWSIGGVTLLASAASSESSRAAGIGTGFALASYVANYLANLQPDWGWLARYSIFAYWDPQGVIRRGTVVASDIGVILAIAMISMFLAVIVFVRRDIAV